MKKYKLAILFIFLLIIPASFAEEKIHEANNIIEINLENGGDFQYPKIEGITFDNVAKGGSITYSKDNNAEYIILSEGNIKINKAKSKGLLEGIALDNVKQATIIINRDNGIEYASFTATKPGKYILYFKGTPYTFNVNKPDSFIHFNPMLNVLSAENTDLTFRDYSFSGAFSVNLDQGITSISYRNGEFKQGNTRFFSSKPFYVYLDKRPINEKDENAVYVRDGHIVAKGIVSVEDSSSKGALSYRQKSKSAVAEIQFSDTPVLIIADKSSSNNGPVANLQTDQPSLLIFDSKNGIKSAIGSGEFNLNSNKGEIHLFANAQLSEVSDGDVYLSEGILSQEALGEIRELRRRKLIVPELKSEFIKINEELNALVPWGSKFKTVISFLDYASLKPFVGSIAKDEERISTLYKQRAELRTIISFIEKGNDLSDIHPDLLSDNPIFMSLYDSEINPDRSPIARQIDTARGYINQNDERYVNEITKALAAYTNNELIVNGESIGSIYQNPDGTDSLTRSLLGNQLTQEKGALPGYPFIFTSDDLQGLKERLIASGLGGIPVSGNKIIGIGQLQLEINRLRLIEENNKDIYLELQSEQENLKNKFFSKYSKIAFEIVNPTILDAALAGTTFKLAKLGKGVIGKFAGKSIINQNIGDIARSSAVSLFDIIGRDKEIIAQYIGSGKVLDIIDSDITQFLSSYAPSSEMLIKKQVDDVISFGTDALKLDAGHQITAIDELENSRMLLGSLPLADVRFNDRLKALEITKKKLTSQLIENQQVEKLGLEDRIILESARLEVAPAAVRNAIEDSVESLTNGKKVLPEGVYEEALLRTAEDTYFEELSPDKVLELVRLRAESEGIPALAEGGAELYPIYLGRMNDIPKFSSYLMRFNEGGQKVVHLARDGEFTAIGHRALELLNGKTDSNVRLLYVSRATLQGQVNTEKFNEVSIYPRIVDILRKSSTKNEDEFYKTYFREFEQRLLPTLPDGSQNPDFDRFLMESVEKTYDYLKKRGIIDPATKELIFTDTCCEGTIPVYLEAIVNHFHGDQIKTRTIMMESKIQFLDGTRIVNTDVNSGMMLEQIAKVGEFTGFDKMGIPLLQGQGLESLRNYLARLAAVQEIVKNFKKENPAQFRLLTREEALKPRRPRPVREAVAN